MNYVFALFIAHVSLFFAVMVVREASLYFQSAAKTRSVRYSSKALVTSPKLQLRWMPQMK